MTPAHRPLRLPVPRPLRARLAGLGLTLALAAACADPGATTSDASATTTSGATASTSAGETAAATTAASTTMNTTTMDGSTTSTSTTSNPSTTTSNTTTTDSTTTTSNTTTTDSTTTTSTTTTTEPTTTTDPSEGSTTTGGCVLGSAAEMSADALSAAVVGVTYPSESDYPWTVITFACAAPVTVDTLKMIIEPVYVPHEGQGTLAERSIELRTSAQLFDPLTVPQDWWSDDESMLAEQYTAIRMIVEGDLSDLQVFRIGQKQGDILSGAIDVYVLGATGDGDLVGMWTVSIET